MASRSSCHDLCLQLDRNHIWEIGTTDSALHVAMQDYNSKVQVSDRLTELSTSEPPLQKTLSKALDASMHSFLSNPAQADLARRAHLNLTSASGAGQWLHAIPTKALHRDCDPLHYKTMLQRWLRAPIFDAEFFCPSCDGVVDIHGDHCLVCSGGGDRSKRHNLLRNECHHLCRGASFNSELERPNLLLPRPLLGALPENGIASDTARRPADVYVPRWRHGVPACLDFAVTSGLRREVLSRSAADSRAALIDY